MGQLSKGRVLITGINGFSGLYMERAMKNKGYDVYGTSYSGSPNTNYFKCNILKKKEIAIVLKKVRPKYIIHLAAISFVGSSNPKSFYETNVIGTLNILEVLDELDMEVKKLLLASSAAVYGNIGNELSEGMPPKPINHYGNSKLVMENMAGNYFNRFNIVITRPFNYTGIGQNGNFLIPKIVNHFKEKSPVIQLGNLNTYREYNSVETTLGIYINLLESSFGSDVVNVCSGTTYSIKEILDMMSKISNHSINVEVNPNYVRKNEIRELKGSKFKLNSILNRNINYISLEETLKSMYFS